MKETKPLRTIVRIAKSTKPSEKRHHKVLPEKCATLLYNVAVVAIAAVVCGAVVATVAVVVAANVAATAVAVNSNNNNTVQTYA